VLVIQHGAPLLFSVVAAPTGQLSSLFPPGENILVSSPPAMTLSNSEKNGDYFSFFLLPMAYQKNNVARLRQSDCTSSKLPRGAEISQGAPLLKIFHFFFVGKLFFFLN